MDAELAMAGSSWVPSLLGEEVYWQNCQGSSLIVIMKGFFLSPTGLVGHTDELEVGDLSRKHCLMRNNQLLWIPTKPGPVSFCLW